MNGEQTIVVGKSFFANAHNLQCRRLDYRFLRFLCARLRTAFSCGQLLADDPRVIRAWKNGWDAAHFLRFQKLRDEGFCPTVIYDIGAHEGIWSEMCQSLFSSPKFFLFEPQPLLQKKIRARQRGHHVEWSVFAVALGDRDGTELIHLTRNPAASSLLQPVSTGNFHCEATTTVGSQKIDVVTLDGLVEEKGLPPPSLVKIDVQGFEGRVLAGGRATLAKAERIVMEVSLCSLYHGQPLLTDILRQLADWGFDLEDISEVLRHWPSGRLMQVDLWLKRKAL